MTVKLPLPLRFDQLRLGLPFKSPLRVGVRLEQPGFSKLLRSDRSFKLSHSQIHTLRSAVEVLWPVSVLVLPRRGRSISISLSFSLPRWLRRTHCSQACM